MASLTEKSETSHLPPNVLFIGQSNAAGRSRPYSPPEAVASPSLRRSDEMLSSCDPKKASAGYSPLNYLHHMYSSSYNFARGGTSLREWTDNFDEWLPTRFDGAADVVWIQGESDLADAETVETYALRLRQFIRRLSKVYRIERLFVVCTTSTREVSCTLSLRFRSSCACFRVSHASLIP